MHRAAWIALVAALLVVAFWPSGQGTAWCEDCAVRITLYDSVLYGAVFVIVTGVVLLGQMNHRTVTRSGKRVVTRTSTGS